MTARVLVRRATALLTLALIAACGSDDSTAPTGNFTLSAPVTTISAAAGTGGQTSLVLGRTGGFNGAITLSVESVSPGLTAVVNPGLATSNVTTVLVDYSLVPSADTATRSFVVRAKAPGRADQTVTVKVKPSTAPGFAAAYLGDTVRISNAGVQQFRIPLNRRGGFAGIVDVIVDSLPAGVRIDRQALPFVTANGDTAVITLRTDPTPILGTTTIAAVGSRTLRIRLSPQAPGVGEQIVSVPLVVSAIPGFNVVVTPTTQRLTTPGSLTYSVSFTRSGSFAAPIGLVIDSLPNGVTASVNQFAADSATVTLTGSPSALGSATNVRFRGTSAGELDRPALATLNVTGLLTPGVTIAPISGASGSTIYYRVTVPTGTKQLVVETAGGLTGNDVDVSARFNALPTSTVFACASTGPTAAEKCVVNNPSAGDYFVLLQGTAYSSVSITATLIQ